MNNLWTLMQLSDSAIPTGGFVASSGLEVAHKDNLVYDITSLTGFVRVSLQNYCHQFLPSFREAYFCNDIKEFYKVDRYLNANLNGNQLSRQTSMKQGYAFLQFTLKTYKIAQGSLLHIIKDAVLDSKIYCNLATIYPICIRAIDEQIDLRTAAQLFAFLQTRSIVSAAVRLNIVGPFAAQQILAEAHTLINKIVDEAITSRETSQTAPLLDLIQSRHVQLYSRIFTS